MAAPWDPAFERLLRPLLPNLPPDAPIEPGLDMIAAGLDSLNVIGLLASVEDHYDILLDDEEIAQQTVETPATLWAVVSGHLTRRRPHAPGRR
jgi:acyl carrier protein